MARKYTKVKPLVELNYPPCKTPPFRMIAVFMTAF